MILMFAIGPVVIILVVIGIVVFASKAAYVFVWMPSLGRLLH